MRMATITSFAKELNPAGMEKHILSSTDRLFCCITTLKKSFLFLVESYSFRVMFSFAKLGKTRKYIKKSFLFLYYMYNIIIYFYILYKIIYDVYIIYILIYWLKSWILFFLCNMDIMPSHTSKILHSGRYIYKHIAHRY